MTNGEKYAVGDKYPHRGFASKERVAQLSTTNNKRGIQLIKSVETAKEKQNDVEEKKYYTKSDIMGMKVADLRKLATEQEIEDADNISGAELKNLLVEKMGL